MGEWELENRDLRSRHPDEARSKFERWVLSFGGTSRLSREIGVHQVSVCAWVARRCKPNIDATAKILELARGELALADIIDGTRPH